jgi:hypothetical protein
LVRFRRELRAFQRCDLVTRIAYWDDRAFYFDQRFEDGETLFAQGFVRGVIRRHGKTVPTSEVLTAFGQDLSPPPAPPGLSEWISALHAL